MSDQRLLKRLLVFWCGLAAVQLASGLWLFSIRYGWSLTSIGRGHFGDGSQAALGWTTWGEIVGPHLFAIGTFTFILAHLLAFVPAKGRQSLFLALSLMVSGLALTLSGGAVMALGPGFAWIKLVALLWFELSFALAAWKIIASTRSREA